VGHALWLRWSSFWAQPDVSGATGVIPTADGPQKRPITLPTRSI